MPEQEPWVSVDVVAKHLGIARDTVYRWIDAKEADQNMLAVAAASTGRLAAYVLAHSVDVPLGTPRSVAPGALAIHLGGYILTWQSYSDQPPKGLPAHRIGRLWKFKVSQIDEWVEAGHATAAESGEVDR